MLTSPPVHVVLRAVHVHAFAKAESIAETQPYLATVPVLVHRSFYVGQDIPTFYAPAPEQVLDEHLQVQFAVHQAFVVGQVERVACFGGCVEQFVLKIVPKGNIDPVRFVHAVERRKAKIAEIIPNLSGAAIHFEIHERIIDHRGDADVFFPKVVGQSEIGGVFSVNVHEPLHHQSAIGVV